MMKRSKKTRRIRANSKPNLALTSLEPKNLLAGISFSAGVITIDGSSLADSAQVQQVGAQLTVIYAGVDTQQFNSTQVTEIVFNGLGGDDWFKNASNIRSRAFGHTGSDTLIGGSANDRLRGGGQNDRMFGNGGNDFLGGDGGDDLTNGGAGDDQLDGSSGLDRLLGESGKDTMTGGTENDYLDGGSDDDTMYGYLGNDRMLGGLGNDTMAGQGGDDSLFGDDGDDSIYGNDGSDYVDGGNHRDRIVGGSEDDRLQGSSGIDDIFGQAGDDKIYGGDDNDRVYGDDGSDDVYGSNGDDFMRGGVGLDRLFGQSGSDDMSGDDDNDDLFGGIGVDIMRGGIGNDDFSRDSSDSVFDDSDDYSPDGDFEIRGTISNLNTTTKTFSLLGLTIDYSQSVVRLTLADGAFVKAEGLLDGTTVLAREIEPEDNSSHNFEARGTISNLDTTAKTFSFLGLTVNYSSATVSQNLANGQNVEVEGTLSGTTVNAHRVGDDSGGGGLHDSNGAFELRAEITNLDTTAKTFTLLGLTVNYSSAQVYGTLANGTFIKVDGLYSGGTIQARQVEIELPDDRDENVQARGEVSNLDTTNQTFTFLGFTVDYSDARIDDSFNNGDSIEIRGWFENLAITAERIGA